MSAGFDGQTYLSLSSRGLAERGDGIGARVSFADVDRACHRFLMSRDPAYRASREDFATRRENPAAEITPNQTSH